ncbi:Rax2p Ecym_4315 [Eremothecium cymbalariae DBVPG|uniref:Bud site selection protein RAX2 n=1 Tax=Eremothecium cymbalariae (strain CBS 270.75 / DBVPG 7215 / KCTC 17166 / NRRL Y-17582) TaxID=931890 RepID=G8JTM5_ERECY|nr:hypothetical protein Ecym_4315 [Eremothecium cymbalariae DBVPG\
MYIHKYTLLVLSFVAGLAQGSQINGVVNHFNITQYTAPHLDLSTVRNSQLLIFDDFQTFDYYTYKGQQIFTGLADERKNSLIYYSNNTYVQLAELPDGAEIKKIVPWGDDSFILSGRGVFEGHRLEHQLIYNLSSFEITEILKEPLEHVNDILTDGEVVYFGGGFTYNDGNLSGHSVVKWDATDKSSSLLPFYGFGQGSVVNNIIKLDDSNILFVGKFSTIDNTALLPHRNVSSSFLSNSTNIETNALASLRFSSLVHDGTLNSSAFVCPEGSADSWTIPHSTMGELTIRVINQMTPSKIRIYNSKDSNNQVNLFRIVTSPSRSIMNMTYVDPITGALAVCDAWCPLQPLSVLSNLAENSTSSVMAAFPNNNNVLVKWTAAYQEFAFVNRVPIQELTFIAIDSFGHNVGLLGIELFQAEYDTYVNNTLNQPNCDSQQNFPASVVSKDTVWYQGLPDQSYMATSFTAGKPSVTLTPSIPYPGIYTLNLVTPGCLTDNTCAFRGIVNVTIRAQNGTHLMNRWIYQNNENLKYDPLFRGYLDDSPNVVLEWIGPIDPAAANNVMVADRVTSIIDSIEDLEMKNGTSNSNLLNGLFQYAASNFTNTNLSTLVGSTNIDQYPVRNIPHSSSLFGQIYNDTLFIGSPSIDGLAKISRRKDDWNDIIVDPQLIDTEGPVTGIFPYSNGLALTVHSNQTNMASSLSFNGSISTIFRSNAPSLSILNLTIDGSEILVFDNGYVYNVSSQSDISNSETLKLSLLSAGANLEDDLILAGNVQSTKHFVPNGAIAIDADSNEVVTSGLPSVDDGIIYRGLFINDSSSAYAYYSKSLGSSKGGIVVYGEHEPEYLSTDDSTVNDMLYIKDSNLLAVVTSGTSQGLASLYIHDLSADFAPIKETFEIGEVINTMVLFGRNYTLLVGGTFTRNGCRDLCLYNYATNNWTRFMDGNITGDIRQLQFLDGNTLMVAGLLASSDSKDLQLVEIDLSNMEIISKLQGTNTGTFQHVLTVGNSSSELIAHDGNQVFHFVDGQWKNISPDTSGQTQINGLTLLSTDFSQRNSIMKRDRVGNELVVINGNFSSPDYGDINAMYYDFNGWNPYYFSVPRESNSDEVIPQGQLFLNKDVSFTSSSQIYLSNDNDNDDTPAASEPATHEKHTKKLAKIFVVLIALALALATVAVLGVVGVLFAYLFGDHNAYEPLKPRINEAEMLKTVPPEKLMKFI